MKHGIDLDEVEGDRRWYRRDRSPDKPYFDFCTLEQAVRSSIREKDFIQRYPKHGSEGYGNTRPASSKDENEITYGAWNCVRLDKDLEYDDGD